MKPTQPRPRVIGVVEWPVALLDNNGAGRLRESCSGKSEEMVSDVHKRRGS